jgi:hypothetical protein
LAQLPLSGQGTNFGLLPVSQDHAIVAQGNGVLTLVDLAAWQNIGSLTLFDPGTQNPINLVGPTSASAGTVYVVAYEDAHDRGTLFAIVLDADTQQLDVRSTFSFKGRSGAKPVVVTADVSGLSFDVVLLHVPGLSGDVTPQNRLLGLADSAGHLSVQWSIPLSAPLAVSPTVDAGSRTLFYESGAYIRQNSIASGAPLQTFNLRTIGGFPASFRLNGHVGGSSAAGLFTLLLSGGVTSPGSAAGQYLMSFQPLIAPTTLLWSWKIAAQPASYSGAFNFAPAMQGGTMCPVAISITSLNSTLTRLCDH